MIFRDVADGCGYNVVLNKLNSMGYRTRLGNTFSKETLYEMLRNEKYNGVYVFSRAASKDELGRRNNHLDKPIEDQIRIPGGMPKIVDDETFARVQAILTRKKQKKLFVDWFGVLWSVWPQILRRLHADWQGQKGCRDLCLQQSQ